MKTFTAKGSFQNGAFVQTFSKEIAVLNKKLAREKIYADFGSKHGCNRRQISITEIKEKT